MGGEIGHRLGAGIPQEQRLSVHRSPHVVDDAVVGELNAIGAVPGCIALQLDSGATCGIKKREIEG